MYNIMFRRKITSLYTINTRLRPAWISTVRKIKLMFFGRQYKNGANTSRRRCEIDETVRVQDDGMRARKLAGLRRRRRRRACPVPLGRDGR